MPYRPADRSGFHFAIICALPLEYDAVYDSFDEVWTDNDYGKAIGDPNRYTTGCIGDIPAVLLLLPGMGKVDAASAAASLRSSYGNVNLTLLVGVCGAIPRLADNTEIILGDVIISKYVVRYDYGRQYPDGFKPKRTIEDALGRPNKETRILSALLETSSGREKVEEDTQILLQQLQEKIRKTKRHGRYDYLGASHDKLFKPEYRHKHYTAKGCNICDVCSDFFEPVCERALSLTCLDLGCGGNGLVTCTELREQRLSTQGDKSPPLAIHIGGVGFADIVMKSGTVRDRISQRDGVIAFEMEGAGVWDELPSCLVIKGVCDYADSHKPKGWQNYAAATAASAAKSLLQGFFKDEERKVQTANPVLSVPFAQKRDVVGRENIVNALMKKLSTEDNGHNVVNMVTGITDSTHSPCYYVQFAKNPRFAGRTSILNQLEEKFFGNDCCQKVALIGLGGVGKTQIALSFVYKLKERQPEYSIFWVPLLSDESAEQAFVEIAKELGLQQKSNEDVKALVYQYLSSDKAGKWLFVIDNADDRNFVYGSMEKPGLEEFFPSSKNGILLMTTRSGHVAEEFAGPDVIEVEQMGQIEATNLLRTHITQKEQLQDEVLVAKLLSYLTFLPLAITQAASYLNQSKVPIKRYFTLLKEAERDLPSVLGREFKDTTRYKGSRNAVGKTWLVSFQQIEQSNPAAARLLSFLSCIEPKAIPQAMIPDTGSETMEWAVGTLCAYSFLVRQGDTDVFDMHSLVHLATRGWVKEKGWTEEVTRNAVSHLVKSFPSNTHTNHELRRKYVPHATQLLEQNVENKPPDTYRLYSQVGDVHSTDRRYKEAVKCYETVCCWMRAQLVEDDGDRLKAEQALATAYLRDKRTKDAIKIFENMVAIQKETLAETDHDRLVSEHTLASAYLNDKRVNDAIKIFKHVVAVRRKTLDHTDRFRLISEYELARAYFNDKRIKDAITILENVVAVQKKTLDDTDLFRSSSEHQLASIYFEDGRVKDAIKIFERVVAVRKETLDETDNVRLVSEHGLARAYLDNGRVEDAVKIFEHVVAVQKEALGETEHNRLSSEHGLARAYLDNGRVEDAVKIFEHVVAVQKEALGETEHNRLSSEHELARAYLENGRVKDAIRICEHVVAVRKETLDETDYDRLTSEYQLARVYLENGRVKDAIRIFEHVVAVWKGIVDEKDDKRLMSEHELARAYLEDGRTGDAIKIFEHVVSVRKGTLSEKDYSRLASENQLVRAYKIRDIQAI